MKNRRAHSSSAARSAAHRATGCGRKHLQGERVFHCQYFGRAHWLTVGRGQCGHRCRSSQEREPTFGTFPPFNTTTTDDDLDQHFRHHHQLQRGNSCKAKEGLPEWALAGKEKPGSAAQPVRLAPAGPGPFQALQAFRAGPEGILAVELRLFFSLFVNHLHCETRLCKFFLFTLLLLTLDGGCSQFPPVRPWSAPVSNSRP